jgi:hypothetical protein
MKLENINNIVVCGDLHGGNDISVLSTKNFPEQKNFSGNNVLLQAGDFGLVWNSKIVKRKSKFDGPSIMPDFNADRQNPSEKYWLRWLDKKPFYTLFIAGNHENYDRLEKYPLIDFCGGKAAQISDKVFYLKNGYVYDIDGVKIWMFGGGTSIDKAYRIEGISWWRQEIPEYSEMLFGIDNLKEHNYDVDYIITHTLPTSIIKAKCYNKMSDIFTIKLQYPCSVSNYLDNVLEVMKGKYKKWYAGHFHVDVMMDEDIEILYKTIKFIRKK